MQAIIDEMATFTSDNVDTEHGDTTGTPLAEWFAEMAEDITPAEQHRASKHRGGRRPKLTENQRRLFGKWTRASRRLRMQHAMDATALRRVLESSGE